MKIHSICLVKDEADIVGDVVKDAARWSDYIYIYDNGSTDGTTDILKDLAEEFSNIIFYKWSDRAFHNTIRGEVFHAFKQNAQQGDWWCRLDGDELYIDDPRSFLSEIKDGSNAVLHSSYNYYFTDKDLKKYNENFVNFSYKDLRYYKNNCSEVRFVKDNGHLYWPSSSSWPLMNMDINDKKIRVRHYQYRDPEQIKKRAKNRSAAYVNFNDYERRSIGYLDSSAIVSKEDFIISHDALDYDDGDKPLVAQKDIRVWKPDNSLLSKVKIYSKNILFRLNLIDPIYNAFGKKQ